MAALADQVAGFIPHKSQEGTQLPLILLTMVIDDSYSMTHYGNGMAVMEGHNMVLDGLTASPGAPAYLVKTRYMHGRTLAQGYLPLNLAPRMTLANYTLIGGTPLFRSSRRTLGHVKRRTQQYAEEGHDAFSMTLFLNDGWNRESRRRNATAKDVCDIAEPMIATGRHIVAGLGVANEHADFYEVFLSMGIPKQWILTLRDHIQINAAFAGFIQLAARSSDPIGFRETVAEGFSNTSLAGDKPTKQSPPQ